MTAPQLISAQALNARTIELTFDQAMLINADFLKLNSYAVAPSPAAFNLATITNAGNLKARINLVADLLDGQQYTVTVSENLQSFAGESMDPDFLSLNFLGVGAPPEVLSVAALSGEAIRVTFDEPIDLTSATTISNYEIESLVTGKLVEISAASAVGGGPLYTKINLTISSKMTDGGAHELRVSNVKDLGLNTQATTAVAQFTGIADRPQVLSAVLSEVSGLLKISFDTPMNGVFLNSLSAFAIISQDGVPPLYFKKVTVAKDRRSVDLTINEPKDGINYLLIASSSLIDDFGNALDPDFNSAVFEGIGTPLVITRAIAVGTNRLDVIFNKKVRDSAVVRDPVRYSISGGVTVVSVISVDGDTIKLATTDQNAGAAYTLTIS